MTAHRFVERLVGSPRCAELDIVLLCDEPHPPYDRVHLGRVIGGEPGHALSLRESEWYADRGVCLRLKERVVDIDREARCVRTSSGAIVEYDRLVLATGGEPILPPIPGLRLEGVVAYRTLEDAEEIARRAQPGRRVVLAGGGLLGLEVARSLRARGCDVTVVEMAPRLLPRQLDAEGARVLTAELEARGVELRLLTRVTHIDRADGRLALTLDPGEPLACDLVVVAAGIRPADGLARAAGLECHAAGGVLVDDGLATSDPQIFALGECVRHRDVHYGFVAPCHEMADVLAARFAGERARFGGSTPSVRLKVDDIHVASVGESLAEGVGVSALVWTAQDRYRRVILREGRIVGAIAVGPDPEFARLQEAVARGSRVRPRQQRRFDRTGRLWAEGAQKPMSAWADAAVVCTCTGVTCGTLRAARAAGAVSSIALGERTGAGRVCGSCEPLLAELAGERSAARRTRAGRPLAWAAATGLALVLVTWLLTPIPMAKSVQAGPGVDVLWRDMELKQVTGFAAAGLALASMLFSLRKRWTRLRSGTLTGWRVLHASLGALTVAALVAHTGLRLGAHLNLALMLCFTAAVLLGSVAGLVTSAEHRLPPAWGARLRRGWTQAHVFVVWPLPVLVTAHVLAFYFY